MPRLCELYPGICLTTEEKARKNLSQGSRRMPVGTMKTEYTEQSVQIIIIKKMMCFVSQYKNSGHFPQRLLIVFFLVAFRIFAKRDY